MLHGRRRERDRLAAALDAARAGRSTALVLTGPPGIGKTALLDEIATADDVRVLRARGREVEADLPYAALLELLGPVLGERARLTGSERQALGSAFALEEGSPTDRFALPAAIVALLALLAEEQPVLALVDDAHWLDPASREALLFAAHRLDAEGVALVLASRDPDEAPDLERLALHPLDATAARALAGADDAPVAPEVLTALVDGAHGNPLALLTLRRGLTDDQAAGRTPLGPQLAAERGVQAAFEEQLAALPEATQRALCLLAAAAGVPAAAVDAALATLDADLAPAEAAGLIDAERAFRHPLLASAAYHGQPSSVRRAVHAALAEQLTDPSRRAWNLARAAAGPDEEVAAALEAAGADARRRGGHAEAVRAYARAAELSTDAEARARRQLEAATDAGVAGELDRAIELARAAAGGTADPAIQGQAERLRALTLLRTGDPEQARQILEGLASAAMEAGLPPFAALMLLEAAAARMMSGDVPGLAETAQRALALVADSEPFIAQIAMLLSGQALAVLGRTDEARRLFDAGAPVLADPDPLSQLAEIVGMSATAAMWLEEFERAETIAATLVARARRAGAVGKLPLPLIVQTQLHWRRGRWAAARADAEEAVRISRETGQLAGIAVAIPYLVRANAGIGLLDEARAGAREGLALAERFAGQATLMHVHAALGFAELTAGRADEALLWLDRADRYSVEHHHGEPSIAYYAADLVEALVRVGETGRAAEVLARLDAQAAATGGGWNTAIVHRGRVLLAADDEVECQAAAALAAHDRVDLPFERARTELVVGERLRRARRRGDAREPLERALDAFDRLGAEPWAERARTELRAAGVAPADHASTPLRDLTPGELQVALLVAEGQTNRDVAGALFISPKTVEHHLGAIYRKLGLASRTQLAALVAAG